MLEGKNRLQSDLDRLQGWADETTMGFNTDKCKVMHLGRKNQQHTYRLGNSFLVSAEAEKDLGVIIDAKMNMGRQCGDAVRKANCTYLVMHPQMHLKQIQGGDPPTLYDIGQAAVGVLCPVLGTALQEGCGQHGEGPEEGHLHDQGAAGQALRGEAMGPAPVQPPQEKAEGGSSGLLQTSQGHWVTSRHWVSPCSPEHYQE